MKTETAIQVLSDKAKNATDAVEALQYSQSALNLAHVEAVMLGVPEKATEGSAE